METDEYDVILIGDVSFLTPNQKKQLSYLVGYRAKFVLDTKDFSETSGLCPSKSDCFFSIEPSPGWALFPLASDMSRYLAPLGYKIRIYDWHSHKEIAKFLKRLNNDPELTFYAGTLDTAETFVRDHNVKRKNMSIVLHSMTEVISNNIYWQTKTWPSPEEVFEILNSGDMPVLSDQFIEVCHKYDRVGYLNAKQRVLLRDVKNKIYLPQQVDIEKFYPMGSKQRDQIVVGSVLCSNVLVKNVKLLSQIVSRLDNMPGFRFDARCVIGSNPRLPYSEMPGYFRDIDILLCTSVSEGGPLPPLQAGACGVPTISTNCGHMSEFVKDGETGYIVESDADAFINKLEHLYANKDELLDMKHAVRKHVVDNWSCKSRVTQWVQFLQDKIEEPKPLISEQMILPVEQMSEAEFALPVNWYDRPKKPGISFLLRAKNEESTIEMNLDSLRNLQTPHEINVFLNLCTDRTEEIVMKCKQRGQNINVYQYPHILGKTGIENMCTPVNSVHSTIWYLNWAMMKSCHEYTFRWDADFIMTAVLRKELESIFAKEPDSPLYRIPAIFSATGHSNTEIYLFSNIARPRFYKYMLWHAMNFGDERVDEKVNFRILKGSIIHDSDLTEVKDYWNHKPWWDVDRRPETKSVREDAMKEYGLAVKIIGPSFSDKARASSKESDIMSKKLARAIGVKQEELSQLANYSEVKSIERMWFLQSFGYELGNFIMATPMLCELSKRHSKPIDVFFESPAVASLYEDCDFINILSKMPKTPPFATTGSNHMLDAAMPNTEGWMKKFVGKFPVTKTYISKELTKKLEKESNKTYIAIIHGCLGEYWKKSKSLSTQLLQYIVNSVHQQECVPVILGNESDLNTFWSKISIPDGCLNYLALLSIKDTSSILAQCDGFISNDSGLYHVAGALDIPGLVLWKTTNHIQNKSPATNIKHILCETMSFEDLNNEIESFLSGYK